MKEIAKYLRLVTGYFAGLDKLRWSSIDDAIEYSDGSYFAFNVEIAHFLEGFATRRPLVHFCFVLHCLYWLQGVGDPVPPELLRLRRSFRGTGSSQRNAGAFFAMLCRNLPAVADRVDAAAVCARLCDRARPIRWYVVMSHDSHYPVEQPPLAPAEFEACISKALRSYTDEELESWLRRGRGPVHDAAEAIAQALPPPTLSGRLGSLLDRSRLAGAVNFVQQLTGALVLPPPRLRPQELPLGGYADVANRGQVDDLLPSQFALDDWDFFRRFAENELLYFRREEPHTQTQRQLIVLLDQGVRTWGDVRIVLSAALVALGKNAQRKRTRFLVATSTTKLIDPLEIDEEQWGQIIEASDFSANPGLALERLLEKPEPTPRDIVLLTHPRSLQEEEVIAAARRLTAPARLFAMTLNDRGQAQLSALCRGRAVPVRDFKVDLSLAQVPADAVVANVSKVSWTGDVEPIGFPFRFGLSARVVALDFDEQGEYLLTAAKDGMLFVWKTDGSTSEILPRPIWKGKLLTTIREVIGVVGGFVVIGYLADRMLVFHYDFPQRKCTGWTVEPCAAWKYAPAHHCLLGFPGVGISIDLGTGGQFDPRSGAGDHRAREAWQAWVNNEIPTRRAFFGRWTGDPSEPIVVSIHSPVLDTSASSDGWRITETGQCYVDPDSGTLHVKGLSLPWQESTPLADGQPLLKNWQAVEAQCGGNTLALKCTRLESRADSRLFLFQGPTLLAEYPLTGHQNAFVLSADGALLARRGNDAVDVRHVFHSSDAPSPPLLQTPQGKFSGKLRFAITNGKLYLSTGRRHHHLLDWSKGVLERGRDAVEMPPQMAAVPGCIDYDRRRFLEGRWAGVFAVADRFGQVAILDRRQQLVCMFFAFRDKLAGWMPDGTRFGPAAISGGPATADAMVKFGQALTAAGRMS